MQPFPDSLFVIFNVSVDIFANNGPIFISLKKPIWKLEMSSTVSLATHPKGFP